MAVNRERQEVSIGPVTIGGSYNEFTAGMLLQGFKDHYGHLDGPVKYVVYCEGDDINETCKLMIDAYRLETDEEMAKRITQEELTEYAKKKMHEGFLEIQAKKEADPEYQKWLELDKKFNGRL